MERAAGNVKGKERREEAQGSGTAPRDFSPAPHLQKSLLVLRMNLQPKWRSCNVKFSAPARNQMTLLSPPHCNPEATSVQGVREPPKMTRGLGGVGRSGEKGNRRGRGAPSPGNSCCHARFARTANLQAGSGSRDPSPGRLFLSTSGLLRA